MPSVGQQFAAVFGAPVPFALAVVAVAFAIWKAIAWLYDWRYGGIIENLRAQLGLVAEERRIASDRENNLASTVSSLNAEVEKLKTKLDEKVVQQLESNTVKLKTQLDQVRQANTAVDDALRRTAIIATTATSSFFGARPGVTIMPQPAPVTVQPKTPVAAEPKVTVAKPSATSRSD